MDQFATFNPKDVTLRPNESGLIDMTITIPQDFPTDVHGTFFSPSFDATENGGPLMVYVENTGIWVSLVG